MKTPKQYQSTIADASFQAVQRSASRRLFRTLERLPTELVDYRYSESKEKLTKLRVVLKKIKN